MPEVLKAINSVWSWLGPILLGGLVIVCIYEATQLVREFSRWRKARKLRNPRVKRLRSPMDRSDLEDAYWQKWR